MLWNTIIGFICGQDFKLSENGVLFRIVIKRPTSIVLTREMGQSRDREANKGSLQSSLIFQNKFHFVTSANTNRNTNTRWRGQRKPPRLKERNLNTGKQFSSLHPYILQFLRWSGEDSSTLLYYVSQVIWVSKYRWLT